MDRRRWSPCTQCAGSAAQSLFVLILVVVSCVEGFRFSFPTKRNRLPSPKLVLFATDTDAKLGGVNVTVPSIPGPNKALANNDEEKIAVTRPTSEVSSRPKVGVSASSSSESSKVVTAPTPAKSTSAPAKAPTPKPIIGSRKSVDAIPGEALTTPKAADKPQKPVKPLDRARLIEEIATAIGGTAVGFILGTWLERQAQSDEATLTAASGATVLGLVSYIVSRADNLAGVAVRKSLGGATLGLVRGATGAVTGVVSGAINGIKRGVQRKVEDLKNTPGRILDGIKASLKARVEEVKALPARTADAAKRKAQATAGEIAAVPGRTAQAISNSVVESVEGVKAALSETIDGVARAPSELMARVTGETPSSPLPRPKPSSTPPLADKPALTPPKAAATLKIGGKPISAAASPSSSSPRSIPTKPAAPVLKFGGQSPSPRSTPSKAISSLGKGGPRREAPASPAPVLGGAKEKETKKPLTPSKPKLSASTSATSAPQVSPFPSFKSGPARSKPATASQSRNQGKEVPVLAKKEGSSVFGRLFAPTQEPKAKVPPPPPASIPAPAEKPQAPAASPSLFAGLFGSGASASPKKAISPLTSPKNKPVTAAGKAGTAPPPLMNKPVTPAPLTASKAPPRPPSTAPKPSVAPKKTLNYKFSPPVRPKSSVSPLLLKPGAKASEKVEEENNAAPAPKKIVYRSPPPPLPSSPCELPEDQVCGLSSPEGDPCIPPRPRQSIWCRALRWSFWRALSFILFQGLQQYRES
ncbi:hypothetical protein NSK_004334 [Nannochloropsis salina CCMP1776]|uniref:Uncharacterized protein n=1 Tax=Nannochloropsis salina CCMP1776 TaxID=1027361 RepID=A0A4D9D0D6_9STRA|nr:hypothetical protein NSK_004334 [Nannochloropsis salina CCMP1776]|eukprot:TFJ84344.1 hypothetical protein NSK_004334 [Nannochloropsis salina CCMP1776]